ncbi:MAG: hypothetical protein J4G05_10505 [Chlorobi bacterium]|nr:hypothetical protein [Chlorobiota bacterium]
MYYSFRLLLLSCLFSYAQQATLERLWSGLKSASGVTDIAVNGAIRTRTTEAME